MRSGSRFAFPTLHHPLLLTPPSSGKYVAEAELQPSKIQDLTEEMGKILSAASGHELKFILMII
jgi:hypothetical protein